MIVIAAAAGIVAGVFIQSNFDVASYLRVAISYARSFFTK